MATNTDRPLPTFPEPDTEPYWEATRNHELRYQVCDDCGVVIFYPRRHCTHCLSGSLCWRTSKGEGTLYTFSVVRRSGHPFFKERAPYVVAWVDLDEGFRMLSNIVVHDPAALQIGQRLRVEWEDHDSLALPLFQPA